MESDLHERPGQFTLITKNGEVFKKKKYLDELKLVFGSIMVISAISIKSQDQIHYTAFSEHFRKLNVGDRIPAYYPVFTKNENEETTLTEWREYNEVRH